MHGDKITNKIEINKEKWRKIWWETKNFLSLHCQNKRSGYPVSFREEQDFIDTTPF